MVISWVGIETARFQEDAHDSIASSEWSERQLYLALVAWHGREGIIPLQKHLCYVLILVRSRPRERR